MLPRPSVLVTEFIELMNFLVKKRAQEAHVRDVQHVTRLRVAAKLRSNPFMVSTPEGPMREGGGSELVGSPYGYPTHIHINENHD